MSKCKRGGGGVWWYTLLFWRRKSNQNYSRIPKQSYFGLYNVNIMMSRCTEKWLCCWRLGWRLLYRPIGKSGQNWNDDKDSVKSISYIGLNQSIKENKFAKRFRSMDTLVLFRGSGGVCVWRGGGSGSSVLKTPKITLFLPLLYSSFLFIFALCLCVSLQLLE